MSQAAASASAPVAGAKRSRTPDVASVSHAIAILNAIGSSRESLGVNEIGRRVGLHKSTVSRLLATLERHGFVERLGSDGRFALGFELVALAGPLIADLDVVKVGRPTLVQLAAETGETVYMAVWNGRDTIMMEQAMGEHGMAQYVRPGTAMPAHASAAGKVFLVFVPGALHAALSAPLPRYTQFTKLGSDLEEELNSIRQRGYALNDQEYEIGSCGLAVPIRDVRGTVVGALTVAVPKYRFDAARQQQLAAMTMSRAEELGRRLGYVVR
ncbi:MULTISPECIES: IclR family transcriptional regulator [unclassified Devosia]|uniref:IclR family transcriptional regulator n=1 Tax=unclassified Devosia TaxID=196773 RepID=UPI001ACE403C|nr:MULTISPECIES: IclR family transcriptional regulator [unclassified Devosia]MBN9306713.1 IclR family transcriptional regulator [Devosia sp.]